MIIAGVVLMLLGFIFGVPILWTLGIVALVVGIVLYFMGTAGHAVGGRRWY